MRRHLAPIVLVLVLLPGCGGSGHYVWVTGKLLQGGAPYKAPEGQSASLTFVAIETQDASGRTIKNTDQYQADLEDDGSYKVPGPEGKGIPPGKYRIAVTQKMLREAFEALKNKPKKMVRDDDLLKDQFGPMKSPIVREIKGPIDLVIDMDKPTEIVPAGG